MNIEELRDYCLSLPATNEDQPFDKESLVFKIAGKMFLLTSLEGDFWINLKCDPEFAIDLRERFDCVRPGYHMNKKHWNTIDMDGSVSDEQIIEWINHSYDLVVKSLPINVRRLIFLEIKTPQ